MKPKKIIGWILIILGLAVVFWAIYSSYSVFTGKSSVPEIFETKTEELKTEGSGDEMEKMVKEQIKNIVPAEAVSQVLNLVSWAILAFILIFGGGRISGIGINLLRKS